MAGQGKRSEFHPDLSESVAANEDEILGLPLSQQVYAEMGYH